MVFVYKFYFDWFTFSGKMCTRSRVRIPAAGIYESLKNLRGSKKKDHKSIEIFRYKIEKFNSTLKILYVHEDFEHKRSNSNWVKCVTRTSDRKPVLGLKNH